MNIQIHGYIHLDVHSIQVFNVLRPKTVKDLTTFIYKTIKSTHTHMVQPVLIPQCLHPQLQSPKTGFQHHLCDQRYLFH